MKKNVLFATIAVVMLNCQNPKAENPPPAPTEIEVNGAVGIQTPTATNSIDYLGIYKGTLPCADCAGVETSIELEEDFTFKMVSKNHDKNSKPVETVGTFRWDADGKTIKLDNPKTPSDQFLVGNGTLIKLDNNGKKIEGQLADKYILKKVSDAAVAKLAVPQQDQAKEIVGIRWKLIELNGYPVQHMGEKPLHIELDAMNAFTGFAGCNNLRGHYETRENRIRFMRIMGTMKGCDQLPTEEKIKAMLGLANNFVRNGKSLHFRDGENLLAKFEAVAK